MRVRLQGSVASGITGGDVDKVASFPVRGRRQHGLGLATIGHDVADILAGCQ